jgi:hypothetical protein
MASAYTFISDKSPLLKKPIIGPIIEGYMPHNEWVVFGLALAIGFLEFLRSKIGAPWVWDMTQELLNDLEKRLFRQGNYRRDEHSVTLFKFVRRRWWVWHGPWLVAVERSGHARRKASRAFRVPDSGGMGSEGIAGQAFKSENVISACELPNLATCQNDADWEKYSTGTFVSVEWLKQWATEKTCRGQNIPRALCGFHVETASGKPWGALVFDSTDSGDLKRKTTAAYNAVKGHLSRLVERI